MSQTGIRLKICANLERFAKEFSIYNSWISFPEQQDKVYFLVNIFFRSSLDWKCPFQTYKIFHSYCCFNHSFISNQETAEASVWAWAARRRTKTSGQERVKARKHSHATKCPFLETRGARIALTGNVGAYDGHSIYS